MAIASLVLLIIVVILANIRKINVGILGFAAAAILSIVRDVSFSEMTSGFGTSVFLRMLCTQFLVCIAKENGTLEYISRKIIKVSCGKTIRLFPIFIYLFMVATEFFGMGIQALVIPILVGIAFEMGFEPLKLCVVALLSMQAGGLAPFAPPGIILRTYAAENGLQVNTWNIAIIATMICSVMFIALYFSFGWHKERPKNLEQKEDIPINHTHILTIVGYVAYIAMNLFLGFDQMVSAIIVASILLLVRAADPTRVAKDIPFTTLIMIGGMSLLVGMVDILGGVELLSSMIATIANKTIAPAFMTAICGIMSVFSSSNGVVFPTMIPPIPNLIAEFPGLSEQAMLAAVGVGAYATAISPLSSTGSYVMAAYGTVYNPTEAERMKVFNKLLLLAGFALVTQTVAALLGVYTVTILP